MSEILFPEEKNTALALPENIQKIANEMKLPQSKAEKYAANYTPYFVEIKELTDRLRSLDKMKPEDAEKAKRVELDFGKMCSRLEKTKKEDKAEYMSVIKYIDALYNAAEGAARLTQKEAKEIATYLATQQQIMEDNLKAARTPLIQMYSDNPEQYALGKLSEEAFVALHADLKKKHEDKQKLLERISRMKAANQVPEAPEVKEEVVPEAPAETKSLVMKPNLGFSSTGGFGGAKWDAAPAAPQNVPVKKKGKMVWFDLETTGLDYRTHCLHQIAGMIEIDGEINSEFEINVRPHAQALIDPESIKVSGKTIEQIQANELSYREGYDKFVALVSKHVDRYDKSDKMFLAGYNNASFDNDFLRQFFADNGDKYFGSYFWADPIDVRVLAAYELMSERKNMVDFKLMTVAKHLGIAIDESKLHDAVYDIKITREILQKIKTR